MGEELIAEELRGPIQLRRACEVLGMTSERGKVRPSDIRRLRRLLRTEGKRRGDQLIFGDTAGSNAWTTLRALNACKLLPADYSLMAQVTKGMEAIHEEIAELSARVDTVGAEVVDIRSELANDKRRRTAGLG